MIGGVVVAGAVVALTMMLGGGTESDGAGNAKPQPPATTSTSPQGPRPTLNPGDPTTPGTPGVPRAGEPGGPPPVATGSNAPIVTPRDQPRGAANADSPAGAQGSAGAVPQGQDYVVGDVRVRDHRGGSNAPMDIPPNVHPADGPRIDSALTAALGRQVKLLVLDCAKGTSRDGRGTQPRVEGQIVIAVKANQASVLSGIMQPRDVSATVASTIKSCIEPKLVGITAPAPNQADLDSYSINMSMQLP